MGLKIFVTKPVRARNYLNSIGDVFRNNIHQTGLAEERLQSEFQNGRVNKACLDTLLLRYRTQRFKENGNLAILTREFNRLRKRLDKLEEIQWSDPLVRKQIDELRNERLSSIMAKRVELTESEKVFEEDTWHFYNENEGHPPHPEKRWCPIKGRFDALENMTAAPLIPQALGDGIIERVIYELSDYNVVWSPENGIPMDKSLRDMFDQGRWTIVVQQTPQEVNEFFVKVLDDDILGDTVDEEQLLTYSDINGRKLDFLIDDTWFRPRTAYIFWHYATSIMRHCKIKTRGIEGKVSRSNKEPQWNVPVDWLADNVAGILGKYFDTNIDVLSYIFDEQILTAPDIANDEEAYFVAEKVFEVYCETEPWALAEKIPNDEEEER